MLGQLIIRWIHQRFHWNRLRVRLLYYTLLALLINSYAVFKAYGSDAIMLFPSFLLWLFMAAVSIYFVCRQVARRVSGNWYVEGDSIFKKRILVLGTSMLILFLLRTADIPALLFYSFLAIPITLSFFLSACAALIWVIRYESRKGTIFVMRSKRGRD